MVIFIGYHGDAGLEHLLRYVNIYTKMDIGLVLQSLITRNKNFLFIHQFLSLDIL